MDSKSNIDISMPYDAIKDTNHWTYKIPGIIAWSFILFCIAGVIFFPVAFLTISRVIAFYMLVRVLWIVLFYIIGLVKIRRTSSRINRVSDSDSSARQVVHHVILLPNRAEPYELLSATLEHLSKQQNAGESISLVLAMEENDPGAVQTSKKLKAQFGNSFANILISFHPSNMPGEVAGKAANEKWAAGLLKEELIDKQGMDPDRMTLTTCDSDSILHPDYFNELTRLFNNDTDPYSQIWQAPLFFDNNIQHVQPIVRLLSFFRNAVQLSELTMPFNLPLAQSTYSLSFRLSQSIQFWDPAVVCEDSHTRLRSLFALNRNISLVPVFLPTTGDAVEGKTFWLALKAVYDQTVRHGWGGMDIGYIIQQLPGKTVKVKLIAWGYLIKLLHDHLLFSTVGFVILFATPVSYLIDGSLVVTLPIHTSYPVLLTIINGSWAFGMGLIWIVERIRSSTKKSFWNLKDLLLEAISWFIFPAMTFLIMGIPVLLAQTKMMLGKSLKYVVTEKRLNL